MQLIKLYLLALMCLIATAAYADDDILAVCSLTPSVVDDAYYPGENIGRTNNLRRVTGSALVAKGEPIYIKGRVVDEDCLPVSDAVVEIWQANSYGKYQHINDKSPALLDKNFAGSGTTRTDNLGYFQFLTIFPAAVDRDKAPRVHVRIRHPDFGTLSTQMVFAEQSGNQSDPQFAKNKSLLSAITAMPEQRTREQGGRLYDVQGDTVYRITFTLKGHNRFMEY